MPADNDVDMIAGAIKKFYKHTKEYPQKLEDLVTDPGIEGWKGSYLEDLPETPWGEAMNSCRIYIRCVFLQSSTSAGKIQTRGVAEISRVYHGNPKEGAKYWWK